MMHFQHDAQVVHHCCNRTRLRVPGRRGDSVYLDEVCRRISELPGVTDATSNRKIGSIIIRHNGEFRMEAVTEALHGAALVVRRGEEHLAELGGEYFPERTRRGAGPNLAAMILQLAVAFLFGTALTHVVELLARNLIETAFRKVRAEAKPVLASV